MWLYLFSLQLCLAQLFLLSGPVYLIVYIAVKYSLAQKTCFFFNTIRRTSNKFILNTQKTGPYGPKHLLSPSNKRLRWPRCGPNWPRKITSGPLWGIIPPLYMSSSGADISDARVWHHPTHAGCVYSYNSVPIQSRPYPLISVLSDVR